MSTDNQAENKSPLISFPHLHLALAGDNLPGAAKLFDPGLSQEQAPLYKPAGLPLEASELSAVLKSYEALGRECKNPAELANYRVGVLEDFYANTSFAVGSALDPKAADKRKLEELKKAQVLLALAYTLEEKSLELSKLDGEFAASWKKFENELGLSEEDLAEFGSALPVNAPLASNLEDLEMPWALVLEAMLAFVPDGGALWVEDPALLAAWFDFGIEFDMALPQTLIEYGLEGLPTSCLCAETSGASLALRKRVPEAKPWLAGKFRVLAKAIGEEES